MNPEVSKVENLSILKHPPNLIPHPREYRLPTDAAIIISAETLDHIPDSTTRQKIRRDNQVAEFASLHLVEQLQFVLHFNFEEMKIEIGNH